MVQCGRCSPAQPSAAECGGRSASARENASRRDGISAHVAVLLRWQAQAQSDEKAASTARALAAKVDGEIDAIKTKLAETDAKVRPHEACL